DQRLEAQALLEGEPRSLADRAAKQQRGDEQHRDDDQRRHGAEDDRSGFQIHGGLLRGAARLSAVSRHTTPAHSPFARARTAAPLHEKKISGMKGLLPLLEQVSKQG